jgi:hypothetical protein
MKWEKELKLIRTHITCSNRIEDRLKKAQWLPGPACTRLGDCVATMYPNGRSTANPSGRSTMDPSGRANPSSKSPVRTGRLEVSKASNKTKVLEKVKGYFGLYKKISKFWKEGYFGLYKKISKFWMNWFRCGEEESRMCLLVYNG